MPIPERGEAWLADLGWAAKTRPVLILSVPYSNKDYALLGSVPHTTKSRGSQFEVTLDVPDLKAGSFNVQGLLAIPPVKCVRKITALTSDQLQTIETATMKWLGLSP